MRLGSCISLGVVSSAALTLAAGVLVLAGLEPAGCVLFGGFMLAWSTFGDNLNDAALTLYAIGFSIPVNSLAGAASGLILGGFFADGRGPTLASRTSSK